MVIKVHSDSLDTDHCPRCGQAWSTPPKTDDLAAAEARASEWQPIETAPKYRHLLVAKYDREPFIGCVVHDNKILRDRDNVQMGDYLIDADVWRPIPDPPIRALRPPAAPLSASEPAESTNDLINKTTAEGAARFKAAYLSASEPAGATWRAQVEKDVAAVIQEWIDDGNYNLRTLGDSLAREIAECIPSPDPAGAYRSLNIGPQPGEPDYDPAGAPSEEEDQ